MPILRSISFASIVALAITACGQDAGSRAPLGSERAATPPADSAVAAPARAMPADSVRDPHALPANRLRLKIVEDSAVRNRS